MEDFLDEEENNKHSSFNIQHYLFKLGTYYKWIILGLVIALLGGYLYLKYQVPIYEVDGYILLGGGELEGGANSILNNAGLINAADDGLNTINNEIFILKSYKIIGSVVDSLDLDVDIEENGRFKKQPVYKDSLPVQITIKKPLRYINTPSALYNLTLAANSFTLEKSQKTYQGKYGQPFILNKDTVLISNKDTIGIRQGQKREYTFKIQGRLQTINKYRGRLSVAQAKNGGIGLLQLSLVDELTKRANKFIDVLIYSYNTSYSNYKNQAIKRALKFLDQRLASVSIELDKQENQVRDFKTNNKLYDVPTVAGDMLGKIEGGDLQKSQNSYQADLLNLVEKSVKYFNGNEEIVANASGLSDAVLSGQVNSYNMLVQQKQNILALSTTNDVRLAGINDQLRQLRESILKNIGNIRKQLNVYNSFLSKQNNAFSAKFETLPEKDKQYIELNRKLSVQEALYTFILQKKEETELQLVSEDVIRSRTVDDILNKGLISPRKMMVYSTAIGTGLFIPCFIIFLIAFLNKKIETRKEIEDGTKIPILGELSMSDISDMPIIITSTSRTAVAEQFRAIRTNLSYIGVGKEQKVFVITSSISGEGKSFVSVNLANSMAIINKKVVVLELDLRKPVLSNKFGIISNLGISEYLINDKIKPEEIISPLPDYPNLYLISSGRIPPNPAELITNPRMAQLINYLRETFDYVIMDTPPVGLVADSISLGQLADTSIFVIRHKYSYRTSLNLVNDLKTSDKLSNLSLIINGIEADNSYGYGYGGYGYGGYGYGYYSEDSSKKSISIFDKFKKMFNYKNHK